MMCINDKILQVIYILTTPQLQRRLRYLLAYIVKTDTNLCTVQKLRIILK